MNASAHRPRSAASGRCPRCGRAFDCGMRAEPAAGAPDCWCRSMPALPANRLKAGRACLCPECLADEIARARVVPEAPEAQ
ncbi:cysteine-rich CWC family protein [Paraburkholderia megapolitana]|nr:cysteine-rich CWC family protein [Paraburkholderia megapolitana]QDQ82395.1 cysteine-rich CWC family protein [Paraburkholderia megapolitana]